MKEELKKSFSECITWLDFCRLGQKFISKLGINSPTKDDKFLEYERKFNDLESSVKNFVGSVGKFNDILHDVVISQFNISNYFAGTLCTYKKFRRLLVVVFKKWGWAQEIKY